MRYHLYHLWFPSLKTATRPSGVVRSLALAVVLLIVGGGVRADEAKDHFDKAVAHYKNKRLDAALEEFTLAHKAAPKDPLILYWIGFLNLQQQKFAEALNPLEQAVQLDPKSAEAHLNLGNVYDGLKRYTEAVKEFEIVAKLQPTSADPYYNLGSVYFKTKRWPDAVTAYRHAAALAPTDPDIQDNLGSALQASGNLAGAVAAYEKATRLAPENGAYWLNLGRAAHEAARKTPPPAPTAALTPETPWGRAKVALARAVQIARASYLAREAYAEMLFDLARDEEAAAQFEKAGQLDPKQYDPLFNLGVTQTRRSRFALAAAAYRRALDVRPESREAWQGLGLAQFKQGQFEEAAKTFTQLTKLAPDEISAWINLSSSLQRKEDEAGAVSTLEEALKHGAKDPLLPSARRLLAGYYYRKGDPELLNRAQEQYLQSLKEAPENAEALNGLGLIALKQKQTDAAIGYLKRAVAVDPHFADAYNNLGVAYEDKKDVEQAVASFRKALQIDPKNALAKKNLALYDKKAGN